MRELFFFAIYVLSHAPQQIDDEQVKRIEHIEDVLRKGAADKAALTVIHIDGDEGQTGYPPAAQHTAADDGLQYWLSTKDIEQQYETIAPTITGVHKALHQQEGKDGKCQTPHLSHQQICRHRFMANGKQRLHELRIHAPIECSQMVDKHQPHGQHLKRTATQYSIGLFHNQLENFRKFTKSQEKCKRKTPFF